MTSEDSRQVGRRIRELRDAVGYTQGGLAERAGIDRASLSQIENGHASPRTSTLTRIARALHVDPAELFADSDTSETGSAETGVHYDHLEESHLYPGLEELLNDPRDRLLLQITPAEEAALRSIRLRSDPVASKEFFIDMLVTIRRHQMDE